jgi:hypothetical protein
MITGWSPPGQEYNFYIYNALTFPYYGCFGFFKYLQSQGVKVYISLGGATFNNGPGGTLPIPDTTVAGDLAKSICYTLLGQTGGGNPLSWASQILTDAPDSQPFTFDGIDIDFETQAQDNGSSVVTLLSTLHQYIGTKKVSSTPQAPYLWPGNPSSENANGAYYPYSYNSPLTSLNTDTSKPASININYIGDYDYISPQFYNQYGALTYPTDTNSNFTANLQQWGYLAQSSTNGNIPKINIGLVGDPADAFQTYNPFPTAAELASSVITAILNANTAINAAGKSVTIGQWLNGFMFWQSPRSNNYALDFISAIKSYNTSYGTSIPLNVFIYGAQFQGVGTQWPPGMLNPGWTGFTTSYKAILNNNNNNNPACFPKGTFVLTMDGYKRVETLVNGDLVRTGNGRDVSVKIFQFTVNNTDRDTAPYCIKADALGPSCPVTDVHLSARHAIQDCRGIWQIPKFLAKHNPNVTQWPLGTPVTYYHIECPNYFTDNLVVGGSIVESYKNYQGPKGVIYVFNKELNGFVRNNKETMFPVPQNPHTWMIFSN